MLNTGVEIVIRSLIPLNPKERESCELWERDCRIRLGFC